MTKAFQNFQEFVRKQLSRLDLIDKTALKADLQKDFSDICAVKYDHPQENLSDNEIFAKSPLFMIAHFKDANIQNQQIFLEAMIELGADISEAFIISPDHRIFKKLYISFLESKLDVKLKQEIIERHAERLTGAVNLLNDDFSANQSDPVKANEINEELSKLNALLETVIQITKENAIKSTLENRQNMLDHYKSLKTIPQQQVFLKSQKRRILEVMEGCDNTDENGSLHLKMLQDSLIALIELNPFTQTLSQLTENNTEFDDCGWAIQKGYARLAKYFIEKNQMQLPGIRNDLLADRYLQWAIDNCADNNDLSDLIRALVTKYNPDKQKNDLLGAAFLSSKSGVLNVLLELGYNPFWRGSNGISLADKAYDTNLRSELSECAQVVKSHLGRLGYAKLKLRNAAQVFFVPVVLGIFAYELFDKIPVRVKSFVFYLGLALLIAFTLAEIAPMLTLIFVVGCILTAGISVIKPEFARYAWPGNWISASVSLIKLGFSAAKAFERADDSFSRLQQPSQDKIIIENIKKDLASYNLFEAEVKLDLKTIKHYEEILWANNANIYNMVELVVTEKLKAVNINNFQEAQKILDQIQAEEFPRIKHVILDGLNEIMARKNQEITAPQAMNIESGRKVGAQDPNEIS